MEIATPMLYDIDAPKSKEYVFSSHPKSANQNPTTVYLKAPERASRINGPNVIEVAKEYPGLLSSADEFLNGVGPLLASSHQ